MNNEKDPITEYLKIVIKTMFTQNIIGNCYCFGSSNYLCIYYMYYRNKIIKLII